MSVECSICLSVISDENRKCLNCDQRHVFHKFCIDLWLETRNSCPICRAEISSPESDDCFSSFLPVVPYEVFEASNRLGLPPIGYMPRRPIPETGEPLLLNCLLYDDNFGLIARNATNWFPQQWINEAAERYPEGHYINRLYRKINMGTPAKIKTYKFEYPINLDSCDVCDQFITNMPIEMRMHYLEKHYHPSLWPENDL